MKIDKDWFVYLEEGTGTSMRLPCKCKTLATSTRSTYLLPIISVYPFVQQASNHPSIIKLKVKALVSCRGNQRFGRCDGWMPSYIFIAWPPNKHREFTEGRCFFRFFSRFTNFSFREFPHPKRSKLQSPWWPRCLRHQQHKLHLGQCYDDVLERWQVLLPCATNNFQTITEVDLLLTFWSDLCWQISVRNSLGFFDAS